MPKQPMQHIKGYELRQQIGTGGFGEVHLAYQPSIGREVAVKIITPQYANHPDFIRRFETEAQTISRLEHPFIIPLHDYWRGPDGAYLVMRYLRGGSLLDALKQGAFELESAMRLVEQISSALALAHRNGVIHRDLKPENILMDEDGNAYLADFGIAKVYANPGGHTAEDTILGSPDYLAPEQAHSEPVTPRTDIYSFGVVLYELLAGQHPFPNISTVERMYKHINEPLPALKNLSPDMLDAVNEVIQKATAKNPAHRYPDALAFATAFREAAAISPTEAGASLIEQLTLREHEILGLIVEGKSNGEIAQDLHIALATVKWHIKQLYKKLRVRNRVQAIVRARELDLIVPDSGEWEASRAVSTTVLPLLLEAENPYKGLRAFQAADARDFFGREKITEKLVKRMAEKDYAARFLAVIGPSGSGKSSLVKAGLMTALLRGDLPGSDRWFIVDMMPGDRPVDELEVALTRIAANQSANLHEHLSRDENGLLRVAGLILPDDDSELVVIVDQFEEVFTLVEDEDARQHFLGLIHAAVSAPRSRIRVIVTLRADFYDRPLHYPDFGDLMRNRMETVLPLSAEELQRAIVKPAERIGVKFEDGLAAAIIDDVLYQPGALPLLQYALTELFERRDNRHLTRAAYQEIGGTVGALAKRADELLAEYDADGQELIRQMFLRLVTLGEGTEDTRRRVARAELMAIANGHADLMDDIISTFADYRLFALDHDPASRTPTVEVAHEAILREWEQLRGWLNESRDDVRMQRQLAAKAAEWHAHEQDKSDLLRGRRLEQLEEWATVTALTMTADERTFLEASVTQRERLQAEKREQEAHTAALKQRAQRVLQALVAVFLMAALISGGLAIIALSQRATAQQERDNAENARATSEANLIRAEREAAVNRSLVLANEAEEARGAGHTDLALALALEAVAIDDPPQDAVRSLRNIAIAPGIRAVLPGHSQAIQTIAFSPDGQLALSGSCAVLSAQDVCTQGELILWQVGGDASDAAELLRLEGHTGWVNSVIFSPNGLVALSASSDGSVLIWNMNANSSAFGEMENLLDFDSGINGLAISPDGRILAVGADDGIVSLWNLESGEHIRDLTGHMGAVYSVAFSPDGLQLASGSADTTIIVWDVETGEAIRTLQGHTSTVVAVEYTTDGGQLLSRGDDLTVQLWDLASGVGSIVYRPILTNPCIGLSPDGRSAYICEVGSVYVMDLRNWTLTDVINGRETGQSGVTIQTLVLSLDGRRALLGLTSGQLVLLNMGENVEVRRFVEPGTALASIDVSPDGHYLLNGTYGFDPILWDIETGQVVRRFEDDGLATNQVNFSPDGHYAVTSQDDFNGATTTHYQVVWDVETGEAITRFAGHAYYTLCQTFFSDNHTILSGGFSWRPAWEVAGAGDLLLWDALTGTVIHRFDYAGQVNSLTLSVDNSRAMMANANRGELILWDVAPSSPAFGQQLFHTEAPGPAEAVFSANETTAFISSFDGTLREIDLSTGAIIRTLSGHDGSVQTIAISPDGRYLLTGGTEGLVIYWDIATGEELRRFAGHAGGIWNVRFSPDGQTAFSSSYDGIVIQWQLADWPLDQLRPWIDANRYVWDFTCEEREQYRIEPLCPED